MDKSNNLGAYWEEKLNTSTFGGGFLEYFSDSKIVGKTTYSKSIGKALRLKLSDLTDNQPLANFTIYSSALSILMSKYYDRENIQYLTTRFKIDAELSGKEEVYPFSSVVKATETVRELIENHRCELIDLCKHQNYLLSNLTSSLDKGDLFGRIEVGIIDKGMQDSNHRLEKCRLIVSFETESSDLFLKIYFSGLREEFVSRFADRYLIILDELTQASEKPVSAIKWYDHEELNLITNKFNKPFRTDDILEGYISLIEKIGLKFPHKIAVRSGKRSLTYHDLLTEADAIARHIRRSTDIKDNTVIGVLMERSEKTIVSMIAILKAGAAFLLIENSYPVIRKNFILNDAGINMALVDQESNLEGLKSQVLFSDYDEAIRQNQENAVKTLSQHSVNLDKMAYVVYTSGSTGNPKGVMISHRAMLNHFHAQIKVMQLSANSRIAQVSPASFVISVWQCLCGLLVNGEVIVYDKQIVQNPHRLIDAICNDGITILQTVPSYVEVMLSVLNDKTVKNFGKLKHIFITGEELKVELVRKWFGLFPEIKVINGYGMSEMADDISHLVLDSAPVSGQISLGNVIENNNLYILDDQQQLCPVDIPGEIYASGIGVALGYVNNEELTNKVFSKDLFSDLKGIRRYRTGDRGFWSERGEVFFMGRNDRQVKVRGMRVELSEIEKCITKIQGVSSALALLSDINSQDIIAFIIARQEYSIDIHEIIEELKYVLPGHMVPVNINILDSFPLTPNGKIDKQRLFAINKKNSMPTNLEVTDGLDIRDEITQVWKKILNLSQIEYTDNFFSVGGNSFKVMELHAELDKLYPGKIEVYNLFNLFTIEDQSKHILKTNLNNNDAQASSIDPISALDF